MLFAVCLTKFHLLMLQKETKTAATAKEVELSSALRDRDALVKGLQQDLQNIKNSEVTFQLRGSFGL